METITRQAKTLKLVVASRGKKLMGTAMKEAGFSDAYSKNPKQMTSTKPWKQMLLEIDDEPILKRIREIALDKNDKRAALQGIDMLLKLKNYYPDQKIKYEQTIINREKILE